MRQIMKPPPILPNGIAADVQAPRACRQADETFIVVINMGAKDPSYRHSGEGRNPALFVTVRWIPAFAGMTVRGDVTVRGDMTMKVGMTTKRWATTKAG
jgi:hypothetical protein